MHTLRSWVRLDREILKGFTLLELIVVIAIIGILATIAVPVYSDWIEKAKVTKAVSEIRNLEKEIIAYQIEQGAFPEGLEDIGRADMPDPWGNPYEYYNVETGKGKGKSRKDRNLNPLNTDFELYSIGKDGKTASPLTSKNSYDDIIRANQGAYVGRASEY